MSCVILAKINTLLRATPSPSGPGTPFGETFLPESGVLKEQTREGAIPTEEVPVPSCPEGQILDEETDLCVLEEPEVADEPEQSESEEQSPEEGDGSEDNNNN